MHISLTEQAQRFIAEVLHPGDVAIDATTGNGHDTLFLARQVGSHGRVFAFDVEPAALRKAREQVTALGLQDRLVWICHSHETLEQHIPAPWKHDIQAVMFNLGYLPGSDKECITTPSSTLPALDQALRLLAPGGRISIIAYTGHPGGKEEADAITRWLAAQSSLQLSWKQIIPENRISPPRLFFIDKL